MQAKTPKQCNLGRANIHENSDYFVKVLHQESLKQRRERKRIEKGEIMVGKEFKLKKFLVGSLSDLVAIYWRVAVPSSTLNDDCNLESMSRTKINF